MTVPPPENPGLHWLVAGDSHVDAFIAGAAQLDLPHRSIVVPGATAVGMRNPNSATNALEVFRREMIPARPGAVPVIQLGEVDCGFVIWHRAERLGESVEAQLDQSIAALFGFVDELRAAGYPKVVLTGAVLPTIRDGDLTSDVANLRREVKAPLTARTELTLRYNARLRDEAEARGQPFIDLTPLILDPATGVVADAFRNPNPKNHHLDEGKAGPMWASQLNRLAPTEAWAPPSPTA